MTKVAFDGIFWTIDELLRVFRSASHSIKDVLLLAPWILKVTDPEHKEGDDLNETNLAWMWKEIVPFTFQEVYAMSNDKAAAIFKFMPVADIYNSIKDKKLISTYETPEHGKYNLWHANISSLKIPNATEGAAVQMWCPSTHKEYWLVVETAVFGSPALRDNNLKKNVTAKNAIASLCRPIFRPTKGKSFKDIGLELYRQGETMKGVLRGYPDIPAAVEAGIIEYCDPTPMSGDEYFELLKQQT